jgi:hypothetical protein
MRIDVLGLLGSPFPPLLTFLFFCLTHFSERIGSFLLLSNRSSFLGFFLLLLCEDDFGSWEDYVDQFDCSLDISVQRDEIDLEIGLTYKGSLPGTTTV